MTKPKLQWTKLSEACELIEQRLPDGVDGNTLVLRAAKEGSLSIRGHLTSLPSNWREHDLQRLVARAGRKDQETFECLRGTSREIFASVNISESMFKGGDDCIFLDIPGANDRIGVITGVAIRATDLDTWLNKYLFWPVFVQEGRPRREEQWLTLISIFLYLERNAFLSEDNFPDDKCLREYVLALADHQFDERTIRQQIAFLHRKFVAGHKPSSQKAVSDAVDLDFLEWLGGVDRT